MKGKYVTKGNGKSSGENSAGNESVSCINFRIFECHIKKIEDLAQTSLSSSLKMLRKEQKMRERKRNFLGRGQSTEKMILASYQYFVEMSQVF